MKKNMRKSLLSAALVPVTAIAVGAAMPSSAFAQAKNPCAPVLVNPCAPTAAPAAVPVNPCAPIAAPAAAPAKAEAPAAAMPVNAYDTTTKYAQAVYGDKMPGIVKNYLRATPYIGTGGIIDPAGFDMLAGLGFKTIVNLNTAEEGATTEASLVAKAGMSYINVPVPTKAPTAAQITELARIIDNPANYPVLIHCESSNRVGAMWALYRASKGVPPMIAIEEGRTVGMKTSREAAVREQLDMPAL